MFVIANFVTPFVAKITEYAEWLAKNLKNLEKLLISQLINGISRILQKLLKYFNGTAISTYSVLPTFIRGTSCYFSMIQNFFIVSSDSSL